MPKAIAQHPLNNAHPIPEQRSVAHRQLIPTFTPRTPWDVPQKGILLWQFGPAVLCALAQHGALERL